MRSRGSWAAALLALAGPACAQDRLHPGATFTAETCVLLVDGARATDVDFDCDDDPPDASGNGVACYNTTLTVSDFVSPPRDVNGAGSYRCFNWQHGSGSASRTVSGFLATDLSACLLYTSPSPRD